MTVCLFIGCSHKTTPSCLPLETYLAPTIREIRKELAPYYEIEPHETTLTVGEYTYSYETIKSSGFKGLYRIKDKTKELLIDPDYLAALFGSPNPSIVRLSPDNNWIAYSPENNSSIIVCKIPDKYKCEIIPLAFYDFNWSDDSKLIYYTVLTNGRADILKSMDVNGENQKIVRKSKDEKEFITLQSNKAHEKQSSPDSLPFDPKSPMKSKLAKILKYNPENYTYSKLTVTAEDGTKVPLSLFYKTQLLNTDAPIIMSEYGAYGKSLDLSFKPYLLYLLDKGFLLAYAHIRGGGEKGEEWHKNGSGKYKFKSYSDIKDTRNFLKTLFPQSNIFLHTRSAGALSGANAAYNNPGIFDAMIFDYPFLDAHSYLTEKEDAISEREKDEWGPQSPLVPAKIPLTLIHTSLNDSVINSQQAPKWIETMNRIPTNQIFLHISDTGLHQGEELAYREIDEKAFLISFMKEHRNIRKQCCPYGRQSQPFPQDL